MFSVVIILTILPVLYGHTIHDARRLKGKEVTAALWVVLALIIILTINIVVVLSLTAGVLFQ